MAHIVLEDLNYDWSKEEFLKYWITGIKDFLWTILAKK